MRRFILPIVTVFSLIIGLLLGNVLARRANEANDSVLSVIQSRQGGGKIEQLMRFIDQAYVDTLNMDELTEDVIITLLGDLDPHSSYIPAKDLEIVNSELEGSFSGIGIQFNLQNDTINVVAVIRGGPSESVGLLAGDRIVEVDDSAFVGKDINNEKVMHTLRGKKGTQVKLGVKRHGTEELLHYTVTRGDIPQKAVDVAYMIVPGTGLIRISKFGETTYKEFINALADLRRQGAERYIIDLRENSGGYMDQTVNMANEFLDKGDLIVYSEGKAYPRYEAVANGKGSFRNTPVVVLQDEFSASASEIFAGAIQDNDRGLIVGRRSFGKGLVQQQIPFADGSAMRLTVARYYTPSGRCIQKPYEMGNDDEYILDILHRFERGEFDSRDSIHLIDTVPYYTKHQRVVYGGGGIMPDVFVPRDTSAYTPYYNRVLNHAYTYQFALAYTDRHRSELNRIETWQEMSAYLDRQNLLRQFVDFAASKGVEPDAAQLSISGKAIVRTLKAYITRNILDDDGFFPLFFEDDPVVKEAVRIIQELPVIIEK